MEISFATKPDGSRIAYRMERAKASFEHAPTVIFLGGYASDMSGTKAEAFAEFCAMQGYGFVRFDYQGHGASDGEFVNFGIGDWIDDSEFVLQTLVSGPVILIGSSMGGWIATKLARDRAERVVGLIGIAAAPDFSEDMFWDSFSEADKETIRNGEVVERPSGYEEPYKISPQLIFQGRENLVLREELALPMSVRLFQGLDDASVSTETALRLAEHANCSNLRLSFVKNSDHSFSRPEDLEIVCSAIDELMGAAGAKEHET